MELGRVSLTLLSGKQRDFVFDYAFPADTSQDQVYERLARPVVNDVLRGFNGTIFAYGQTGCGKSFRRMPLIQTCICGHKLIPTITRGSVEKYLKLAKRLVDKYDVGEYQRGRIHALSDEIELVFGKNQGDQSLLTDYA